MTTLAAQHDCLLLDLDGTLFRGAEPTVGAAETLAGVNAKVFFITNNASRSAAEVADHLGELGFTAKPGDVVTSAQTAAHVLASELAPDAAVLVVGTDALAAEVAAVGLQPVRQWSDKPAAVVQGHSPHTCWADLAEAALAIRGGAVWVATNVDVTLPSERGLLPGNGSMVAALRAATGAEPKVAGKPEPTLFRDALSSSQFRAPLVVGDRLDTDIAGAHAAELPSLMVLTGVSTADDAIFAPAQQRATYIAHDLRGLLDPPERLRVAAQPRWRVALRPTEIAVTATGKRDDDDGLADDGLAIVRAVADAVWSEEDAPRRRPLTAGDGAARSALERAVAAGVLASDSVNTP
jgi:HAD superfamily hydrolase (TIGR01450 family)